MKKNEEVTRVDTPKVMTDDSRTASENEAIRALIEKMRFTRAHAIDRALSHESSPRLAATYSSLAELVGGWADELEAACASPWQPIETAPKKGPILVSDGSVIWISHRPLMSKAQGKAYVWQPLPAPPDGEMK